MESNLLSITVLSLLSISYISQPDATAQCLSKSDDFSKPGATDLSGILDFSLRLFQELVPKDEKANYIFSPYSIWNALVLVYLGSAGQTEAQFRQVLGFSDKISTMKTWRGLENLYRNRSRTSVNTFILANRAYFDHSIHIIDCMKDILHSEIEQIDFGQSDQAAKTINKFVSDTTKGNIKDLFSPSDIQNAIVALVNAAYFKGSWEYVFDERATRKAEFTGLDNTKYTVDMMHQIGAFNYGLDESLQTEIVELPYVGNAVSMLIFLPAKNTIENFDRLTQGLTGNNLENILKKLQAKVVDLSIPKFSLKFRSGNELIKAFKRMGLTEPFGRANFSAFTDNQRLMSLGASVHEAYISVNEEGTVAAAATGITVSKFGGTTIVNCNRPFLFAIRDSETRNVLFMGVYKRFEQDGTKPQTRNRDVIFDIRKPNVNNEGSGRIDPDVDRNNENNPSRGGTNITPGRNNPPSDFDEEPRQPRGREITSGRNPRPDRFNNDFNPTRVRPDVSLG